MNNQYSQNTFKYIQYNVFYDILTHAVLGLSIVLLFGVGYLVNGFFGFEHMHVAIGILFCLILSLPALRPYIIQEVRDDFIKERIDEKLRERRFKDFVANLNQKERDIVFRKKVNRGTLALWQRELMLCVEGPLMRFGFFVNICIAGGVIITALQFGDAGMLAVALAYLTYVLLWNVFKQKVFLSPLIAAIVYNYGRNVKIDEIA